jgi:hypothetical protein
MVAPSLFPGVDLLPASVAARNSLRRLQVMLGAGLAIVAVVLGLVMSGTIVARAAAESKLAATEQQQESLIVAKDKYENLTMVLSEVDRTRFALQEAMGYEVEWKPQIVAVSGIVPEKAIVTEIHMKAMGPNLAPPPNPNALGSPGIGEITFTILTPTLPDAAQWLDSLNSIPGYMDATYTTAEWATQVATGEEQPETSYEGWYVVASSVQLNIAVLSRDFISTDEPAAIDTTAGEPMDEAAESAEAAEPAEPEEDQS